MKRLLALAHKELIQLRRDRLTFGMIVGIPVMQLLLFGYAINMDIRHLPTVVLDHDRSAVSRDLVQRLVATHQYDVVGAVRDYDEVAQAFRRNLAQVAVVIPARFGAELQERHVVTAQLVVDGADPQTVAAAQQAASGLGSSYTQALAAERLPAGLRAAGQLQISPTTWYNPQGETAIFVVPGLVGVILTMTMLMFTSMALVRERERGTLEQLLVSPIRPWEMVVGKILPYVVIGYVQVSLILIIGRAVFDVPLRGSLGLLYGLSFAFIGANLALGLLFSTIAKTQQQAMQMSFFFLLPNILLSGFVFPFAGMPRAAQLLSQCLPLTHFLRIIRAIILKGGTFADVRGEFLWLLAILGIVLLIASARVSKRID